MSISDLYELEYPDEAIAFLETLRREGYLSPGGPEEVRSILDGMDLAGRTVVDLGCGCDVVDHNAPTWRSMLEVLKTGEHCPYRLCGCKPA